MRACKNFLPLFLIVPFFPLDFSAAWQTPARVDSSRLVSRDSVSKSFTENTPTAQDSSRIKKWLDEHADALITGILALVAAFIVAYYTRRNREKEVPIAREVEREKLRVEEQHQEERKARDGMTLEQRYRESLANEHGIIRLIGFDRAASLDVGTMELFVSLRFSEGMRDQPEHELQQIEDGRHLSPEQVLRRAFAGKRRRLLLVLGDPGSGKTTLLKYFAIRCLEREGWRQLGLVKPLLPIIVPLHKVEPDAPFSETLSAWATRKSKQYSAEIFDEWLEQRGALVMLDGLDEISDEGKRRRVCEWIDNAADFYGHSCFVVTSRHTGYKPDKGIELHTSHFRAEVLDFDELQQEQFLKKWFTAAYKDESATSESELEAQAQEVTGAVLRYLRREENQRLRQIAGTPIMLQIMAILWKQYGHLASRRADLYEQCIIYLLERRDRILRTDPLLPAKDAIKVLRPLCLWMQETSRKDEANANDVEAQIKGPLEREKPGLPPIDFIINLRDRAGLLQPFGSDSYIFRHRSFREYLAAIELASQVPRDPHRIEALIDNFKDDWWRETLLFALSLSEPSIFDDFFAAFLPHRSNETGFPDLLRHAISEARGKSVKAFENFVLHSEQHWQKRHNALECLRLIGSQPAQDLVQKVWRQIPSTVKNNDERKIRQKAEEILIGWKVMSPPLQPPTIAGLAKSWRNPFELDTEYILIPGGKYKYSATKSGTELVEVPPLYFAKYPVTNKLYRRFIAYLAGKSKKVGEPVEPEEALLHLPREQFAESLLREAKKTRGFVEYLGKDSAQWAEKLRSTYDEEKRFNGDDQPVVRIRWFAARAYCHWLSELQKAKSGGQRAESKDQKERMIFRLPTEDEWEWAASGGKRIYPWGDKDPNDTLANFGQKVGYTTPVGAYPAGATPEGLMDMAGNVWEWMENSYGLKDYPEARALRGGSWGDATVNLRCAARGSDHPVDFWSFDGFRVVCGQSFFETL